MATLQTHLGHGRKVCESC